MDLVNLYLRMERLADDLKEPFVVKALRNVAADAEYRLNPPDQPAVDSIQILANSVHTIENQLEGKLSSSNDIRVSGTSGGVGREAAIDRTSMVTKKLLRGFQRREIRRFMERHFPEYLAAGTPSRCSICNCHLKQEVDQLLADGLAVRDIADWLLSQGMETSKSSIARHRQNCKVGQ